MVGNPVDWISKLQATVTVTLIEEEYVACFFATQMAV